MKWYLVQVAGRSMMFYAEAQIVTLVGMAIRYGMLESAVPGASGTVTLYEYGSGTWQPINTF